MRTFIYARVSTDKQTTEAQVTTLIQKYPEALIVTEFASGAKRRPALENLLGELEAGDRLVVSSLDRLGRRTVEVLRLIENLVSRQVVLISDREGIDYSTPAGRLVTQIMVSVAEMERSLISERTKRGLAAARAEGRVGGRKRRYPRQDIERGIRLIQHAGYSVRLAAKKAGVSYHRLSYYYKLHRRGISVASAMSSGASSSVTSS